MTAQPECYRAQPSEKLVEQIHEHVARLHLVARKDLNSETAAVKRAGRSHASLPKAGWLGDGLGVESRVGQPVLSRPAAMADHFARVRLMRDVRLHEWRSTGV
jgi:hypothetical protein